MRRLWRALAVAWALLFVAAGVRLLALPVLNAAGERALAADQPVAAAGWFARNLRGNPVERWVAPYNRGIARYADRDWRGAGDDFRAALDLAPGGQRCRVAVNLALALEADGDDLRGLGDEVGARQRYAEGAQVARDTACRPDQAPPPEQAPPDDQQQDRPDQQDQQGQQQSEQQQAGSTADRLDRKQQQPEGAPQPAPAAPDAQRRELQQRDQQAQGSAAQGRDRQDAGARGPQRPSW